MTDTPPPEDRPSVSEVFAAAAAEAEAARQVGWPRPQRRVDRWRASDGFAKGALLLSLLAVILLGSGVVAAGASDDRPEAEVGQLFVEQYQQDPLPDAGRVLLPWVPLDIGIGEPERDLPDLLNAPANLQAPGDASFVRVDVDVDLKHVVPLASTSANRREQTDVVLRADGRDYPISDPTSGGLIVDPDGSLYQGGTVWVTVAGHPTALEVLVTVDGVTQTVAADGTVDAGDAVGLADLPSQKELQAQPTRRCGDARRLDDTALRQAYGDDLGDLKCQVDLVARVPYVDGLGWAEDGREFLLVQVATENPAFVDLVTGAGRTLDFWYLDDPRLQVRLGGEEALSEARTNELNTGAFAISDPDDPTQLIFDVPAGETPGDLSLTLVLPATLGDPFVTDRRTVRIGWTVPAEELT